jgi:hypothetical protein
MDGSCVIMLHQSRFLVSTHYTHYDFGTFLVNFASLLLVIVPKLPIMDKVRLFGINDTKPK